MGVGALGKKGFTALAGLIVAAFLAGPTLAQMMGHGAMGGSKPRLHRPGHGIGFFDVDTMKQYLGLDDAQAEKLKDLRNRYRKDMIGMRAKQQVAQIELWEMLDTKDLNLSKVEKKVKEVEGIRTEIMMYRVKALQETKGFLSAEQYENFRKMGFGFMRGGFGGRYGAHGDRPSGMRGMMPRMMPRTMPPGMPPHGNIPGYEDYEDYEEDEN